MTTIVKASGAAHLLSLVPAMLGFTPTRSLVVVPFQGGRSAGVMRLDLPSDDADLDAIVSTSIGMVCRISGADGFTAVIYTDAACTEGLPHPAVARLLADRAAACGLDMKDALVVASDGWGSHVDPETPPRGRPLSELDLPVPDGLTVAPGDQSAGTELPEHPESTRTAVAQSLRAVEKAAHILCGALDMGDAFRRSPRRGTTRHPSPNERVDPAALAAVCDLDDVVALFERLLKQDAAALAPYDFALLGWCLRRPAMRDVALVQWVSGRRAGVAALDAQHAWENGAPYPADLAMTMWGEGPRPSASRLQRALDLTRHLAAVLPRAAQPGALSMCAWLSWALGHSTHAGHYAQRAVEIEPEHGLSEIVLSFVNAAHLPDWTFQRGERVASATSRGGRGSSRGSRAR